MSPYTKAALAAIRLLALGCVVVSVCLCLPDLFLIMSHKPLHSIFMLMLKALPLVAGVWLFCKSQTIAEELTKDLD